VNNKIKKGEVKVAFFATHDMLGYFSVRMYGYLVLFITPFLYTILSTVLFDCLTKPGQFSLPENSTVAQITATCEVWREAYYTVELSQAYS